jgi:hypothetical protein
VYDKICKFSGAFQSEMNPDSQFRDKSLREVTFRPKSGVTFNLLFQYTVAFKTLIISERFTSAFNRFTFVFCFLIDKDTFVLFSVRDETHIMPRKPVNIFFFRKGKDEFHNVKLMVSQHLRCFQPEESIADLQKKCHKSS